MKIACMRHSGRLISFPTQCDSEIDSQGLARGQPAGQQSNSAEQCSGYKECQRIPGLDLEQQRREQPRSPSAPTRPMPPPGSPPSAACSPG
jgi:hypothetical protein